MVVKRIRFEPGQYSRDTCSSIPCGDLSRTATSNSSCPILTVVRLRAQATTDDQLGVWGKEVSS